MPERTATTVSFFFFICHDAAPSLVCNFFALFARLAILHPSFLFSGVFLWGRKKMEPRIQFQYRRNAEPRCLQADETFVCKRPKRAEEKVRDVRVCLERFAGKVKQHTLIKDNPERREK